MSGIFCNYSFFFQAEDGIRDTSVTGVQTCALPISQPSECAPHGEDRCAADVQPVDLAHARGADAHGERARPHHAHQTRAAPGREQLRVTQAADDLAIRWKHHGRGHHRTGEGTAACFIDTGDESAPRLPERDLALERRAGASHASCFSAVSGTTTPRFSRIRAALPARRRRKYSLARRTRPLRSSSISAIAGECSGKMRSTPTPAEILRTVKVALIPAPRRPMHTPSNACSRSLSPSRTRTMTRTVSPGSNAGRLVLRPSRSTALSRSIRSPSILISAPQIGPPLACQPLGLRRPPGRDLLVVTAQQYRRDIHSAIARRPRVARRG